MNSKERCIAVLEGRAPDRVPLFPLMMFFAADRAKMDYQTYATNGAALAEAQINLFENYRVDAVTVSSDAYRLSADMGADMTFPQHATPFATRHFVKNEQDVRALRRPDVLKPGSRMRERVDSVQALVKHIGEKALVLGWVEMPFAEACDWCGVCEFMMMIYDEPALAHEILEFITPIEIEFALAQLDAGAPMIGCGDAAASLISAPIFREFALPYEQRICAAITKAGGKSKLHMCGNSQHLLPDLVQNGADLYNIDHMVDLSTACEVYSAAHKSFKGNVNPVAQIMQATPEQAHAAAKACLAQTKGAPFMLSAGCEIPAATSDESYFAFANAVV